jgi:phage terminase small subunit
MAQPGRRSTAARSSLSLAGPMARLTPPAELDADERQVFVDTVLSCEPTHFRASDLPLLTIFCRETVLERRAAVEFNRQPIMPDGRPSPWVAIRATAVKNLIGLTLRLRLSPQARGKPSSKAEPQLSVYERMNLLEPSDDESEDSRPGS